VFFFHVDIFFKQSKRLSKACQVAGLATLCHPYIFFGVRDGMRGSDGVLPVNLIGHSLSVLCVMLPFATGKHHLGTFYLVIDSGAL